MDTLRKPLGHEVILQKIERNADALTKSPLDRISLLRIKIALMTQLITQVDIPSEAVPDVVERLRQCAEKFADRESDQGAKIVFCLELAANTVESWESIMSSLET